MKYFQFIPKVAIPDSQGNNLYLTNLLTRVNIIPELLNNTQLFYNYDVQENDTPESVAQKYYGTVDNFWLVMFSNQIFDPQWDWPLPYNSFINYINGKYGSQANAQAVIDHYEVVITTTNSTTIEPTTKTIVVDETEYNNTTEQSSTVIFPSGEIVTTKTAKYAIDSYTNELRQNEAKRNIKLKIGRAHV